MTTGTLGCSTAQERVFTRLLAGMAGAKSGSPSAFASASTSTTAAIVGFSSSGLDNSSTMLTLLEVSTSIGA